VIAGGDKKVEGLGLEDFYERVEITIFIALLRRDEAARTVFGMKPRAVGIRVQQINLALSLGQAFHGDQSGVPASRGDKNSHSR
jgi:hypothetical protein